ncbi:MAG TPA: aldehyde dehydrogenase EutE [bacterium]|nr:aldehyde dehydrogenase EutE [bacterium]
MISEREIKKVVEQVVAEVAAGRTAAAAAPAGGLGDGVYADMEQAIAAAQQAHAKYLAVGLQTRKKIVAALRATALEHAESLGRQAVEETGLGKMPDKMLKIQLAANKTPGVEDVEPYAFSGDDGMTLVERAPFGVVGVITPSTNPAETVLNNGIGLLAAGNVAVYNFHPGAKKISARMVQLMHRAIVAAGGPPDAVTCVAEPTQDSAAALMRHRAIRMLLVTGGGEVVKLAMTSGKRCICGGPGNPPVVVDESADIPAAAKHIVDGVTFDNNVLCIAEKEIFVVDEVADQLIREMQKQGAQLLTASQTANAVRAIIAKDPADHGVRHPVVNKKFVGKSVAVIGQGIGVAPKPGTRMFLCEVKWDHVFVMAEQLMPLTPIVRCRDVDQAMEYAIKAEQGNGHTFMMHSRNVANLSRMAQRCNASIFVKNGPSYAGLGFGGEGFTTLTIASPTGDGLTRARTFTRERRCVLKDYFRIV